MNIARLVSRRHWKTKLCRSRWLATDPIADPIANEVCHSAEECKGADVVLAYKPLDFNIRKLDCPVILQMNEVQLEHWDNEIANTKPDGVVFHHLNDYEQWAGRTNSMGIKSCHIPHVAEPSIFFDCEIKKDIDVLLVGALGDHVYPLRSKFAKVLPILKERGFTCKHLQHPGHAFSNADSCKHLINFAHWINRSRIVCFCSSIYGYRLAKYVEVLACGSVIAADYPSSMDEIPMISIDPSYSVEAIAGILEDSLFDSASRAMLKERGIAYAAQHQPTHYCERLLDFISEL